MPRLLEALDWEQGVTEAATVLAYGGLLVGWVTALLSTFYASPPETEHLLVKLLTVSIPSSALAVLLLIPSSIAARLLTALGAIVATTMLWIPQSIDRPGIGQEVRVIHAQDHLVIHMGGPIETGRSALITRRTSSAVSKALKGNALPVRLCLSLDGGDSIAAAITAAHLRSSRSRVTAIAANCAGACGVIWAAAGERYLVEGIEPALAIHSRESQMPGRRGIVQAISVIGYLTAGLNPHALWPLVAATPDAPATASDVGAAGLLSQEMSSLRYAALCAEPFLE